VSSVEIVADFIHVIENVYIAYKHRRRGSWQARGVDAVPLKCVIGALV
jgi:hypothetical protein